MWTMNGLPINEVPSDVYGFIYCITYEDGKHYYGKKNFFNSVKLPALKSGIQRPNSERIAKNVKGKRKYFDILQKESDWKTYEGSNNYNSPVVQKEILAFAKSKRELTYLEEKCLFQMEALEDDMCVNSCIGNRYFKGNIE